jgi:MYXO-CTERM domain-containing protein
MKAAGSCGLCVCEIEEMDHTESMKRFGPALGELLALLCLLAPACYIAAGYIEAVSDVTDTHAKLHWSDPNASLWWLAALSLALGVFLWRRRPSIPRGN